MLHAFANEVRAQNGKKIDADFANLLISATVGVEQLEEAM